MTTEINYSAANSGGYIAKRITIKTPSGQPDILLVLRPNIHGANKLRAVEVHAIDGDKLWIADHPDEGLDVLSYPPNGKEAHSAKGMQFVSIMMPRRWEKSE